MLSCRVLLALLCLGLSAGVRGQEVPEVNGKSLASRLMKVIFDLDDNMNGLIEPCEVDDFLFDNYDKNHDGCVSDEEWREEFIKYDFTPEAADSIFSSSRKRGESSICPGLPTLGSVMFPVPVKIFVSVIVGDIIDMCEKDESRYRNNADCRMIPLTCQFNKFSCGIYSCLDFVFNKAPKRLGVFPFLAPATSRWAKYAPFTSAFQRLVEDNDKDGDGEMTGEELGQAVQDLDVNQDGCLDRLEFKASFVLARCNGYGLTEETADARFRAIVGNRAADNSTCYGLEVETFANVTLQTPDFIDRNLMTIIDMCESNPQLYRENRDCSQLMLACTTSRLAHSKACEYYVDMASQGLYSFNY